MEPLAYVPPAEFETQYSQATAAVGRLTQVTECSKNPGRFTMFPDPQCCTTKLMSGRVPSVLRVKDPAKFLIQIRADNSCKLSRVGSLLSEGALK